MALLIIPRVMLELLMWVYQVADPWRGLRTLEPLEGPCRVGGAKVGGWHPDRRGSTSQSTPDTNTQPRFMIRD